jgi:cell wall-associated NlpC family hydrolase
MRPRLMFAMTIAFCAIALRWSAAQDNMQAGDSHASLHEVSDNLLQSSTLSPDERSSIITTALHTKVRLRSQRDCSHLVHAIYEHAGFPYSYAPSSEIYTGIEEFQRVKKPQAGDLVVWQGHVGIVIKPREHLFFSFLRFGPGTDDYEAAYWKQRGRPRFYRYIRQLCTECDDQRSRRLVNVNR